MESRQRSPNAGNYPRSLLRPLIRQHAVLDAFFRKQFRPNSLATWFLRALRVQHHRGRFGPSGNYFEFGLGKGRTMLRYVKALKLYCRLAGLDPYSYSIFGFDSFQGLPPKQSPRDDHPDWAPGLFHHPFEEVTAKVGAELDLKSDSVRFIKGFFQDVLTAELAQSLAAYPPSIVTIDVDYYSSSKMVLDWLLPFAPSGCLFYFDDIWAFYGHPELGELAAINESNKSGPGCLLPYSELGTTVGGKTYIFVRKEFEGAGEFKRPASTQPG